MRLWGYINNCKYYKSCPKLLVLTCTFSQKHYLLCTVQISPFYHQYYCPFLEVFAICPVQDCIFTISVRFINHNLYSTGSSVVQFLPHSQPSWWSDPLSWLGKGSGVVGLSIAGCFLASGCSSQVPAVLSQTECDRGICHFGFFFTILCELYSVHPVICL